MFINKGKKYSKAIFTILSYILYNAKVIGLIVSIPSVFYWMEKYTSANSSGSGEYLFWYSLLLAVSILLFYFDKQWMKLCDFIIDFFVKKNEA